jgi:hypothetical protein
MEFPKEFILTPYNLFAWKEMIVHIQGRGSYRLTMDTDTKPTSSIKKSKYLNRMDEAFGTICSLISPELFHISSCKTPNEGWTTMERIFGKQDEMRGHIREVELLIVDLRIYQISNISLPNIRICCRNSRLAGLIYLRRRKKWFSPLSPNLVWNIQCLYPHFIQLGSPLEPLGRFPLLRSFLNL